ncbi:MAG: hypothetical protein BGO68_06155 [Candidatus Amoebophilus sp. 36-38]|nr:MAG: hypothetical protein BGO68_06155 [Candidatus Amoebophilus sp. 36-38]
MLQKYTKHAYKIIRSVICIPLIVVLLVNCKNNKSGSSSPSTPRANSSNDSSAPANSAPNPTDSVPNPIPDSPPSPPNRGKSVSKKRIKKMITASEKDGFTLLTNVLVGISKNREKIDINKKDPSKANITALHEAAEMGDRDIIQFLLQNGADVNATNNTGLTPLHLAVREKQLASIQALVKNKHIDINKQDKLGNTVLHIASFKGDRLLVTALVENKEIDINVQQGGDDATPLYLAAAQGHIGIVEILLAKGARTDIVDRDGKTPLDRAANDAIRQLIEKKKS